MFLIFPRKQDLIFFNATICMKCQILFSGKNKKNIINLPSAELPREWKRLNIFSLRNNAAVNGWLIWRPALGRGP